MSVFQVVTVVSAAKTAEPIEISFGVWTQVGQGNHVLDGFQIPMRSGSFDEKEAGFVKYRDCLPWAVQKRLNRSIFRLGIGLR